MICVSLLGGGEGHALPAKKRDVAAILVAHNHIVDALTSAPVALPGVGSQDIPATCRAQEVDVAARGHGRDAIGVAGKGKFVSGALEMSNVDLAEQFTDMIVTQRGFQANSRTITTSDQMIQELLTLKR